MLLAIAALRRGRTEVLVLDLPVTAVSQRTLRDAATGRSAAAVTFATGAVLSLWWVMNEASGIGHNMLGLLAALVFFVGLMWFLGAEGRYQSTSIGVDLDASRRWVTLSRVHADFAAACHTQRSHGLLS